MAFPVLPVALAAASVMGGIVSASGGRKALDPQFLRQFFGAQAISEETQRLFNLFLNSPTGQQMTTEARLVGTRVSGQISQALGASQGQRSAVNEVRNVLASEAGSAAVRDVKANLFSAALQGASETIGQQLQAFAGSKAIEQQQPTTAQQIGGAIAGAGGRALAGIQAQPATADTTGTTLQTEAAAAPVVGAAGFNVPTQGTLAQVNTAFSPSTRLNARRRTGTMGQQFGRQFGGGAQPGRF